MKYSDLKRKIEEAVVNESLRGKTVVFTFGRFQPPTTGHQKLVDALVAAKRKYGAEAFLYPARTNDPQRNPLTPAAKIKWLRRFFGDKVTVIDDPGAKTMFDVLNRYEREGVAKVIMIVGGDRVAEMRNAIKPYLNTQKTAKNSKKQQKTTEKLYNFEFSVESAGERDPDADGVEGMSASKMRAAAQTNDFKSFSRGIPQAMTTKDAEQLFRDLRKSMKLKENTENTAKQQISSISENNENPPNVQEVGSFTKNDGKTVKFWLDEDEDIVFAVEIDENGNAREGGYGSVETMLSIYPDSWGFLKSRLPVISRRSKHRRTEDIYAENTHTPLLKPWMLEVQALLESGWGTIASVQYMMTNRCTERLLPLSALRTPSIVKKAYEILKDEYEMRKSSEEGASSWRAGRNKSFYEFYDLFTKAMKSSKSSDWKLAQAFVCKNGSSLNLHPKVSALLIAGPA
jgi:hypothetical protein